MRKSRKFAVVAGSTVGALAIGGVAFAYWSTSGDGSGTASTSTGNGSAVSITGGGISAMYPGDSPQTVTATLKNNDLNQKVRVTGVTAYLTVAKAAGVSGTCDETDYLLGGQANADAAHPVSLTFSAVELGAKGSTSPSDTATGTVSLQFNDKDAPQDACKGATVTLHYASN